MLKLGEIPATYITFVNYLTIVSFGYDKYKMKYADPPTKWHWNLDCLLDIHKAFMKRRRILWINLIHESTYTIKVVWSLRLDLLLGFTKFNLFHTKVIAARESYGPLMKSGNQVSKLDVGFYTNSVCCHRVDMSCHLCPLDQTHCSQILPWRTFNCLPMFLLCGLT